MVFSMKSIKESYVARNVLGMVAFVIAVILLYWIFNAIYTRHGQVVVIPDVTHMSEEDAFSTLEHAGLVPVVVDTGYNKNMDADAILFQQPLAGGRVKKGREIYLTVNSTESPTLVMPDIADNCDANEAKARLEAMGFKVGPPEYVPGDKDWVIAVKVQGHMVSAGDRIPADRTITLVVGNSDQDAIEDEEFDQEFGDSLWESTQPIGE